MREVKNSSKQRSLTLGDVLLLVGMLVGIVLGLYVLTYVSLCLTGVTCV